MKLKGKITKFIFTSESGQGLALFISFNNSKKFINIIGPITRMKPGVVYEIEGNEEEGYKAKGKQFRVTQYEMVTKFEESDYDKLLKFDSFNAIGASTLKNISELLTKCSLEDIKKNNSLLDKINISEVERIIFLDAIELLMKETFNLEKIFIEKDLSMSVLFHLFNKVIDENQIMEILKNDIYNYAYKNNLNDFKSIDNIALAFGEPLLSDRRVSWVSHNLLKNALFNQGHTYLSFDAFKALVLEEFLTLSPDELPHKLMYAKNEKFMVFPKEKAYTYESWNDEELISDRLSTLVTRQQNVVSDFDFEKLILEIENEVSELSNISNFKYSNDQKRAILNFINNDFSIITGGPGTGKSSIIVGISKMFEKLFKTNNMSLLAPTGRASARIKEVSGYDASTIHRHLKYIGNNLFLHNESAQVQTSLLIVDETSMVDQHLFAELLRGTSGFKKFVIVGDVDQLPAIGYGNLFEDLIESNKFAVTTLKENFRQKKSDGSISGIIELAYAISNDTVDTFDFNGYEDIEMVDNKYEMNDIFKTYSSLLTTDKNKNTYDLQVITPMKKYDFGVVNLNNNLQKQINTNSEISYKRMNKEYKVEDKIMYMENNPTLEIYNGDVGIIQKINFKDKKNLNFDTADIAFGPRVIPFKSADLSKSDLAYACTVHKTQGSEYENVILVLDHTSTTGANYLMINKKLLYTAVTRAKSKLFIFAPKELFVWGAKKLSKPRLTTLKLKINDKIFD